MAKPLDQTGVIQVNGAWATSIKYSAAALGPDTDAVELRFMQGRAEVARASLPRGQLGSVLGEENRATIERHLANDADKYLAVVTGDLRGRRLHYQDIQLATAALKREENSIGRTPIPDRAHAAQTPPSPGSTSNPAVTQDATAATPEKSARAEDQSSEPPRAGTATSAAPRESTVAPVPPQIAAKYLVKGNTYHFDDQTVAFVDQGTHLTAQTNNKAIIQDLVAIAQAREWQAITVSGTQAFRRAAWKEAAAAGLTVSGYNPSALERAALERQRNRSAPAGEMRDASPSAPTRAPAPEPAPARDAAGVTYGQLVAYGEAPYRHDPAQSASYFVTVKDAAGQERTSWGVGLKEAMRESQTAPAVNDVIGIRRTGTTPVTVVQRSVDENGEIIAQTIDAKRRGWQVEKAEFFTQPRTPVPAPTSPAPASPQGKTVATPTAEKPAPRSNILTRDQEAAAAIRSAATTREELQLKYPELNRAVFQHLASHDQFAEAYVKAGLIRESDRAQVIAQMRERLAGKVESGATLRSPNDKDVNTLIRRSVNRVAADIGRAPVEVQPRAAEPQVRTPGRDEIQVRM